MKIPARRLAGARPHPRIPRPSLRSEVHDPAPAAWLGIALGIAFGICFVTGVVSHLVQSGGSLLEHDVANGGNWRAWPTTGGSWYRITQGLHVVTGVAAIPLLLIKLFVVYPRLFTWPPVRSVRHFVERATLPVLIGGSMFQVVTGLQNAQYWYPWGFFFPVGHYWAAWVTIGALIAHIGAKATIATRVVREGVPRAEPPVPRAEPPDQVESPDRALPADGGLNRRSVLTAAAAASGLVVATYAGGTVRPLRALGVLNARDPAAGPQGFPVNKTAAQVRVTETAMSPDYRLRVTGAVERPLELTRDELAAAPQREAVLPIACVEGWSASARWRGVPVRWLLEQAGAASGAVVRVASLQASGLYRASDLSPQLAADADTLLALQVGGEDLHIDHGFPLRLIAPNNPGVLQTKWVASLEVMG